VRVLSPKATAMPPKSAARRTSRRASLKLDTSPL
jgi:hypothetical protein